MQPKLQLQSIQIPLPCEPFRLEKSICSEDALHLYFKQTEEERVCPSCGGKLHVHAHRPVDLRALPVDRFAIVHWHVEHTVYRCTECEAHHSARIPFRFGKDRITVDLAKRICKMLERQDQTVQSVSTALHLSWERVKSVHEAFLQEVGKRLPKPDSPSVCVVDEFSIEKGHRYATLCINGKTKQVLHTARGNTKESFEPFFSRYDKPFYDGIGAFAMDQNAQYEQVVRKHLGSCPVVSDYFHMLKNYSDQVLDPVRLRAARASRASGDMDGYWRYKRANRLQNVRLAHDRDGEELDSFMARKSLEDLMERNAEMDKAVHMRERLQWIYGHCRTEADMAGRWDAWVAMAKESGIPELEKYARKKDRFYRRSILAHAEHPVSSGVIEGCMNKIKVLKRVAFGYRDMDYFFLRIMYLFLPSSIKRQIWSRIWDAYGCPDQPRFFVPEGLEQQKTG